jgi:hypothetical protein
MFHVKHFGTIGGLGKHTFAARGEIREMKAALHVEKQDWQV